MREFGKRSFDLPICADSPRISEAARQLQSTGDAVAINAGVGISGNFADATHPRDKLNLIHFDVIPPVHLAKRLLPDIFQSGKGASLHILD